MDSFTQRMIEKAEQRNRALGLDCASFEIEAKNKALSSSPQRVAKSPITKSKNSSNINKMQVVEKTKPLEISSSSGVSSNTASSKVLRQFSTFDKENMDLGIEISIVSKKDFEVQVEVEEQEYTDTDEGAGDAPHTDISNQPLAKIRETSRNRLQRLGALYSNTDDLSSPIHRTEGQFHADTIDDASHKKPKQKYGKLAALANSINEWEDDTSLNFVTPRNVPPPKPDLPSRRQAPQPPQQSKESATTSVEVKSKTKKLNWDPKVINSLEAQGFQRRESSTVKLAYDYGNSEQPKATTTKITNLQDIEIAASKSTVTKLVSNIDGNKNNTTTAKATAAVEKNQNASVPLRTGLVSGRAAVFEQKAGGSQQAQRPQKDPTELTLKERMQLFERNKGEALIPKAALGMAPSINQIRQENALKKDETRISPTTSTSNIACAAKAALVNPSAENKVRNKVAALVASATTISENKIRADIQKQRDEDMQVLANRFHKHKETIAKDVEQENATKTTNKPAQQIARVQRTGMAPPPPPPPPPPPASSAAMSKAQTVNSNSPSCSKRRSPGDSIEDDESKRARKTQTAALNRLYPALSDLDSNASQSDNDNCGTTATVSPINQRIVHNQQRRLMADDAGADADADEYDDEDNDSYMAESEMLADDGDDDDSSAGICNDSLGRDIFKAVVQKNDNQNEQQSESKQKKAVHYADKHHFIESYNDSSINSSDGSMCVDDCIDEALDADLNYTQSDDCDESDAGNSSRASRGSKGTAASNSFSFRKTPHKFTTYRTISEEQDDESSTEFLHRPTMRSNTDIDTVAVVGDNQNPPVTSNLTVNQNDQNMVTLVHTVSFYRRQQSANSASNTPVRRICREEQIQRSALSERANEVLSSNNSSSGLNAQFNFESTDDDYDGNQLQQRSHNSATGENEMLPDTEIDNDLSEHLVQEKIKKLLDEVCKQQQVIAQTSQALNLCAATVEFSGSTESVEGERHLLVATHRRQACLDEVQRLRVEKSLRPQGAPKERGRLTVQEISVPLRQDYKRKLAAGTFTGHHLVCLLKYNEHVLATKTMQTLPGLLAVKFPDLLQLNNVYADFKVTLEIYGMTAQREVLPHEIKYHINLNKKSGIKTPKKKGSENILVMPPVQSPAGPNVVRTPALVQYGFAIFSLREIQRTTWSLTQVLGVSPLEGVVYMKVQCELSVSVEYRGFLTMYEDISGFGAWHRRWCHLHGSVLNYWKYPGDEREKTPIGSIDLYSCISPKVAIAPRDICARLHTILLECKRPAKDTDQESLIIVPNGKETIVRYLLSADTIPEREEWCAFLNKSLALLRAWGPPN